MKSNFVEAMLERVKTEEQKRRNEELRAKCRVNRAREDFLRGIRGLNTEERMRAAELLFG